MRFDCIILDFDGTFTEVEKEAQPFLDAYRAEVAELIGDDVAQQWESLEKQVRTDPGSYGWRFDGRVVAPANADPYLRATVVTNLLLDARGILPDLAERDAILQRLYADNYPKARAAFRDDARAVIEALIDTGVPVYVVTNSAGDAVAAKLDELAPRGRDRLQIRGGARKYMVTEARPMDERFASIPEEERLPGLARPIYLRRGRYYELLRDVWEATGASPDRTIIIGDIYELDLAMPARLGVEAHLLARPTTPPHERQAVLDHGGTVSTTLTDALRTLLSA